MTTPTAETVKRDPYAALRYADFRLLFISKTIAISGEQMAGVAIGWHLYEITRSELALGLVGLVQVIPVISLSLFAGHVADRYHRRTVALLTYIVAALISVGLYFLVQAGTASYALPLIYTALLGLGIVRTFNLPAIATLVPQVVPEAIYPNAVTWNSNAWQLATIVGPAIGGAIIAANKSAAPVFLLEFVLIAVAILLMMLLRSQQKSRSTERATFKTLSAGFRYIMDTKVILAAVTLDMFAVLFGGATALLPVYAKDILNVGADGLGWLQAAPSLGAMIMSVLLVNLPPFEKSGRVILLAVIGFGVATILFGVSTSFTFSLVMLFLLGALDFISVVIRHSLVLIYTPDEMRGRVSAVNNVFIGTSNQLGAFESGAAAAIGGPIFAVVSGGIGTIVVVLWVAWKWPQLRDLGRLEAKH